MAALWRHTTVFHPGRGASLTELYVAIEDHIVIPLDAELFDGIRDLESSSSRLDT